MDIIPARWRPLAFGSALAGVVILAFGYLGEDNGEGNDDAAVIPLLIVLVVCAVVGYLLWRNLAARRDGASAAVPALAIGIVSIALGLFYWTGLVYFVAPAGIALGASAGEPRGRAGMILSAVSLVGAIIWGVVDAVL